MLAAHARRIPDAGAASDLTGRRVCGRLFGRVACGDFMQRAGQRGRAGVLHEDALLPVRLQKSSPANTRWWLMQPVWQDDKVRRAASTESSAPVCLQPAIVVREMPARLDDIPVAG